MEIKVNDYVRTKEIEEVLNELKRRKERYNYCKNNDISFSDEDYNSHLLLSYIEQLENNRDKAINYTDITKELYEENKKLRKAINTYSYFWETDAIDESIK